MKTSQIYYLPRVVLFGTWRLYWDASSIEPCQWGRCCSRRWGHEDGCLHWDDLFFWLWLHGVGLAVFLYVGTCLFMVAIFTNSFLDSGNSSPLPILPSPSPPSLLSLPFSSPPLPSLLFLPPSPLFLQPTVAYSGGMVCFSYNVVRLPYVACADTLWIILIPACCEFPTGIPTDSTLRFWLKLYRIDCLWEKWIQHQIYPLTAYSCLKKKSLRQCRVGHTCSRNWAKRAAVVLRLTWAT